jgi:hypothetical protein
MRKFAYVLNPFNPLKNTLSVFSPVKTLEKGGERGKVANSTLSQFLACSVASSLIA